MIEIPRLHQIRGAISLQNDRQLALLAMLVASIARGRTIIEDLRPTAAIREFATWLNANGFEVEVQAQRTIVAGQGFFHQFKPLQSLPQDPWGQFLALILLSQDTQSIFCWETPVKSHILAEFSGQNMGAEPEDQNLAPAQWKFTEPDFRLQSAPDAEIAPRTKVRVLLQALFFERSLEFFETNPTRDVISGLLAWFGAPLEVKNTSAEMDEFSRRLARLQGVKNERKIQTNLGICKMLTGKDYFVPGDPTEAGAGALLASLLPDSEITMDKVLLNPTRAGIFGALKRMGAEVEITQRRERYGDAFGTVKVKTARKLQGRRFTSEILNSCYEEAPLLAVAAAFAEGETILRMAASNIKQDQLLWDSMLHNLKLAAVDLGIYEEGLVIRGRSEVDAADFSSCTAFPTADLAIYSLALAAHGKSSLNSTAMFEIFPNFPYIQSAENLEG